MNLKMAILLGTVLLASALGARTWTLNEGGTLEAELTAYKNGTVILLKADGQKLLLQIEKFSPSDREHIREQYPQGDRAPRAEEQGEKEERKPVPERSPENKSPDEENPESAPLPHLLHTSIGESPPEFTVYAQGSDQPIEFNSFRGKLTLVHFWSPRVEGSVQSLPYLAKLYEVYHPLGLEMVSIAIERNRPLMNAYEEEVGLIWPAAIDRSQKISNAFGVQMLPTFVLVDHNGLIASDNARVSEIENIIRRYLGLNK